VSTSQWKFSVGTGAVAPKFLIEDIFARVPILNLNPAVLSNADGTERCQRAGRW
jgi:hypothetical protein